MTALSELDAAALRGWLAERGFAPSHAARVMRAHYAAEAGWPPAHPRLPARLGDRLREAFCASTVAMAAREVAADGTVKLLLRLADGATIESVLMPGHRPDRAAGCLSSQVGCAMGCDFCATARGGFRRNLTAGEIADQFRLLRREARALGRRLETVVFMGMGEPLHNPAAVTAAARRIADGEHGALGGRQVTVSTVGIVPAMDELTASDLAVNLAVSIHAPDDATRARLIPAGRRYALADVLAAADRFQAHRGRPVNLQYCLLEGVNDSPEQAAALATLLAGRRMHVNLLRYNPTGPGLSGRDYRPTPPDAAEAFATALRARGAVAHLRRARGEDIAAACGQLRQRHGAR